MPLTEKGKKMMSAMKKEYGKKKGESVFYATVKKKKLKGMEKKSGQAFHSLLMKG